MENILTLSISIGLVVSMIFGEILGVAAGGMIVPGYVALYLNKPSALFLTLLISFVTYFAVNTISYTTIIYGKRKSTAMLLTGFFLGHLLRVSGINSGFYSFDFEIIGYIIPGIIAIWMDKQGIVETISALMTSSIIVRCILILIDGNALLP